MASSNLHISLIQQALTNYSREPEKEGITEHLQSQFQQPTMAKVFKVIGNFIESQPQSQLKSLRILQICLTKLFKQEVKYKASNQSILCKSNRVADFFYSIFIPNWSQKRSEEIQKTRQELSSLIHTVQKKIVEHHISEKLEAFSTLKKDKELLQTVIIKTHAGLPLLELERDWIDPIFCDFYYHSALDHLCLQAEKDYQDLQEERDKVVFLTRLFKSLQSLFLKEISQKCSKDCLETKDIQQLMLLLIVKLDLSPSLLKVEASLSPEELKAELGQTLVYFSAGCSSIIKFARRLS